MLNIKHFSKTGKKIIKKGVEKQFFMFFLKL